MTTYSSISNASLAVGAIPSSSVVTALRDNPIAMAEAASGAPINVAGWHPVDKVTVGDGKTGLIYDFSTSGAVGSVVTPDFEDGYEYRVVAVDMVNSNSGSSVALDLDGYFATTGAYRRLRYGSSGANNTHACDLEILLPRIATKAHLVNGWVSRDSDFSNVAVDSLSFNFTAQKLTRARVKFSANNIAGGKVYFFRRRDFASSP